MRRSMSGTAMEWLDHFKRDADARENSGTVSQRGRSHLMDARGNPIEYDDDENGNTGSDSVSDASDGTGNAHAKGGSNDGVSRSRRHSADGTGSTETGPLSRATTRQPFALDQVNAPAISSRQVESHVAGGKEDSRRAASSTGSDAPVQPRTSVPLKGKTYKMNDPGAMPQTIGEE